MSLNQIGLKYRFILFSILSIVLTVVVGSLAFHHLVLRGHGYSPALLIGLSLFYILVGTVGVFMISKYMIQPIVYLNTMVNRVRRGDLDVTILQGAPSRRKDELDRLMEGFDHMVKSLRAYIQELTRAKEEAEKTSQELFQSKSRLEAILNGISDGIMILDREYRIVGANPVIERFMGRSMAEIRGQKCHLMCNGTIDRCSFCRAEDTFQHGEHVTSYCIKQPANFPEERILEIHDFPLYNEQGEVDQIIEYVKDVTEAVKTQARLESARRLAQIGEMAAKVAHEVRNPLNAIQGATHYLRGVTGDPEWYSYLTLIDEQVGRLNRVASELLEFSKPMAPPLNPGRLDGIIQQALRLSEKLLQERNIQVHCQIEPNLPAIPLDAAQLEQVLVNLIQNAADAMPEGGELSVQAKMCYLPDNGRAPYIQLLVEDSGQGMEPHVLQRVFDPFFTTKTKGTGLGLSIVKKIVESHQGRIHIESEKNRGTRITISLPTQPQSHDAKEHHLSY
ncbi:MAG: sensor histidine kinase [Calditrichaeota bacterium]|nr:MAG: sensor histidine kinase [Calditrichota bacterium]